MDTNDQREWGAVINGLISDRYMIPTYDYPQHRDDQSTTLEDAISFVRDSGANDKPKELLFYPGKAHGKALFVKERESIIKKLQDFTTAAFSVNG
ncbi:hypothetical protein [uncultured Desulfobacter sp.]|uniref:hypothetical protein n=1 Tax=uncultured Desulfobacter sp. TaxID=240139 RepID=UPI002AAB58D5|nr:hypothetical protein [uncultured Desulfobacter sp.]